MGHRKKSIGIYPMAEGFRGLKNEHIQKINRILGAELSDEFYADLEGELNGWLLRFGNFRELRYGLEERRIAKRICRHAGQLARDLNSLGDIATIILDRYAYNHEVTNERFISILEDLEECVDYLEDLAGEEINVAALQVQAVAHVLRRSGISETVSHDTRGTLFVPSPFVRLINVLWGADERLRVYEPYGGDDFSNLSQWVSARLAEDVDFGAMKLVRRPRLN